MDFKDIGYAQLSAEQLDSLKKYEDDFTAKYGNQIFLLAYNKK